MLKDLKAKLSNAPVPEEVEKWRRRSKRSRHASQDYPSLSCRGMWVLQFSFGPNLQADWGHEVFAGFGCASYHSNSWPGSHARFPFAPESREGGKAGPCNHRRQTVPHQWDTLEAGLLCGLRGSQCPPIHPGFAHCYRGKAEESTKKGVTSFKGLKLSPHEATVKPYNKKLSQSCQTLANFLPGRVPLRNFSRAQTLKAHF